MKVNQNQIGVGGMLIILGNNWTNPALLKMKRLGCIYASWLYKIGAT